MKINLETILKTSEQRHIILAFENAMLKMFVEIEAQELREVKIRRLYQV